MSDICLCGSGHAYHDCCAVYHSGAQIPATAGQLMRSRYTAFALGLVDYLIATWHTASRPLELDLVDNPRWLRLQVVQESGQAGDAQAWVEFKAYGLIDGKLLCLHETSRFAYAQGRWWYQDGQIHANRTDKLGRNDACPCGSGKKFKHCCAV